MREENMRHKLFDLIKEGHNYSVKPNKAGEGKHEA